MQALNDTEVLQRNRQHQRVSISSQQSTCTTQTATTTHSEMRKQPIRGGLHGIYLRLNAEYQSIPWDRLKSIKWKNERAAPGYAYQPTEIEHIANILSHGIWVIPAFYAAFQLLFRSYTSAQIQAASIYGATLASLFTISTCFHGVCYCDRHRVDRNLKVVLHRCDRAMIYVFIAGSYFPWLSLGDPAHPIICRVFKWAIWILAALGILYQQLYHERYKTLETIFYVIMGLGPSTVIMLYGHEFEGMVELKLGGLLYMIGIGFFKSDGIIPFAHSIWHIFVVMAVSVHYWAVLTYLYPWMLAN